MFVFCKVESVFSFCFSFLQNTHCIETASPPTSTFSFFVLLTDVPTFVFYLVTWLSRVRLNFPASLVARCGPEAKLWLMGYERKICVLRKAVCFLHFSLSFSPPHFLRLGNGVTLDPEKEAIRVWVVEIIHELGSQDDFADQPYLPTLDNSPTTDLLCKRKRHFYLKYATILSHLFFIPA